VGSYLQAALLRQRFEGNTIHLTTHLVVARPPVSNAAGIAGVARFAIPELDVDVTKEFSAADVAKTCKQPLLGAAGSLECDLFMQVQIPKSKVELWWPAGHGAQKLYASTVTWAPAGGPMVCGEAPIYNTDKPTDKAGVAPAAKAFGCSLARRDVGFRTIELVTEPLAEAAKELAPGSAAPQGADAEGELAFCSSSGGGDLGGGSPAAAAAGASRLHCKQ